MKRRGLLVSLSGINGAGKTTQANRLVERLAMDGYQAVYTKTHLNAAEGMFSLAERMFGDKYAFHPGIPATLREFVMCCEVLRHSNEVIRPLLSSGTIVIWDRGPLCHEAYGRSYDADMTWPMALLNEVETPDLSLLLDIGPGLAIERISARRDKPLRAADNLPHLTRARTTYLHLARGRAQTAIVDAEQDPETVERSITHLVMLLITERPRGLAGHGSSPRTTPEDNAPPTLRRSEI